MKKISEIFSIFFVKPHPPLEILEQRCPLPEKYNYNWEPVVLKLMAASVHKHFGSSAQIQIWHLMHTKDDALFIEAVKKIKPEFVAFSEIDILVSEVNRLSKIIKSISPKTTTIVGGKHSSLLKKGDAFPFTGIDFAVKGDGVTSLPLILNSVLAHERTEVQGVIKTDDKNIVVEDTFSPFHGLFSNELLSVHEYKVENHTPEEYANVHHSFPGKSLIGQAVSPLFGGFGCRHQCSFCQSPLEKEADSASFPVLVVPEEAAQYMAYQIKKQNTNGFFSLEANMDLGNLLSIYTELEKFSVNKIATSGFIRAADIVQSEKNGTLKHLTKKGLCALSVGLDIPTVDHFDTYKKSFTWEHLLQSLEICKEYGIYVSGTVVGDPSVSYEEFRLQLEVLKKLKVNDFDIRLAIALNNTEYFNNNKMHLIYPAHSEEHLNRQNYRYQTLQFPGKIRPEETYGLVMGFY
ncbi:MAG: radical SAM protein [Bacteroidota bacterium]